MASPVEAFFRALPRKSGKTPEKRPAFIVLSAYMHASMGVSNRSRSLLWLAVGCQAVLGAVLFVMPDWSAQGFPWRVTPFAAMTLGGCWLGTASIGWLIARHRRWNLIGPSVLYLTVYYAGQVAIALVQHARVAWGAGLTAPYVAVLLLGITALISIGVDSLVQRPAFSGEGPLTTSAARAGAWLLALGAFGAALLTLGAADEHWLAGFAPPPLTAFTRWSLGAFYAALSAGALSVAGARRMAALTLFAWGVLALSLPLATATLLRLDVFNLAEQPQTACASVAWGVVAAACASHVWSQRHVETSSAIQRLDRWS